eukprot:TCONS_00016763-protein
MYIDELNGVYLLLNVERLKAICDLQKGILRRQNRFKRILNIYNKLYQMVNQTSTDSPSLPQDSQEISIEIFTDNYLLLQRVIEKHILDLDQMESQLRIEQEVEQQNENALLDERKRINQIQQELCTMYRREDKIAKTLQASNIPTGAYKGFREEVLSGLKNPDEEISYEEYSSYCQVKWTLESVDMEYFDLTHCLFDYENENNQITDTLLNHIDQFCIEEISNNSENAPQNMYNIYGFDGFCKVSQDMMEDDFDYIDPVYQDQEEIEDVVLEDQSSGESSDEPWKEPGTNPDQIVEYVIDNIDFDHVIDFNQNFVKQDLPFGYQDNLPKISETQEVKLDELLVVDNKRFSSYLRESTSTTNEEDNNECEHTSELDLDLFLPPHHGDSGVSSLRSSASELSRNSASELSFNTENEDSVIMRSSNVLTRQNKKDSLKRLSSSSSTSSITESNTTATSKRSSVSSTGSKDSKTQKRRINCRRRKLIGTADKDLFFLPPEDFDDDLVNKNNVSSDQNKTHSLPSPKSKQPADQETSRRNSSGHKKLHRLSSNNSSNKSSNNDIFKKLTEKLSLKKSSSPTNVTNVQNIVVDGRLLKVGDLTPYNVERLSIKNRPRKLSIYKNRVK